MVGKEDFVPGIVYYFTHPGSGEHLATATLYQWEPSCYHAYKASDIPAPPAEKVTEKAHWDLALQKWIMKDKEVPLDHRKNATLDKFEFVPELKRLRLLETYASVEREPSVTMEFNRGNNVDSVTFYAEDLTTLHTYRYTMPNGNARTKIWFPSHGGRAISLNTAEIDAVIRSLETEVKELSDQVDSFIGYTAVENPSAESMIEAERILTDPASKLVQHTKKGKANDSLKEYVLKKKAKKTE